jgi:hypothetical protein
LSISRTSSITSQYLEENGDSRSTYRDDAESGGVFGNNFPLSQISLASGDELLLLDQQSRERDDEAAAHLQQTHQHGTRSSTSHSSLERKPSFLGPGSHYDGGGFQFMSGLSQ